MVCQNGCVDCLQIGGAGELDLKDIKEGHEAGVKHVSGAPRRTHGTHKLDVLHVFPVQLLATVVEALQCLVESDVKRMFVCRGQHAKHRLLLPAASHQHHLTGCMQWVQDICIEHTSLSTQAILNCMWIHTSLGQKLGR